MIIECKIVIGRATVQVLRATDSAPVVSVDRLRKGRPWAERLAARLWNQPTGHLVKFQAQALSAAQRAPLADHIVGGAK